MRLALSKLRYALKKTLISLKYGETLYRLRAHGVHLRCWFFLRLLVCRSLPRSGRRGSTSAGDQPGRRDALRFSSRPTFRRGSHKEQVRIAHNAVQMLGGSNVFCWICPSTAPATAVRRPTIRVQYTLPGSQFLLKVLYVYP